MLASRYVELAAQNIDQRYPDGMELHRSALTLLERVVEVRIDKLQVRLTGDRSANGVASTIVSDTERMAVCSNADVRCVPRLELSQRIENQRAYNAGCDVVRVRD